MRGSDSVPVTTRLWTSSTAIWTLPESPGSIDCTLENIGCVRPARIPPNFSGVYRAPKYPSATSAIAPTGIRSGM